MTLERRYRSHLAGVTTPACAASAFLLAPRRDLVPASIAIAVSLVLLARSSTRSGSSHGASPWPSASCYR
jgi:hypothetical protein